MKDAIGRPAPRKDTDGPCRERMVVSGMVQGVGFRPYVYRLARKWGLSGFVRNEPRGVLMELEGPSAALEGFFSDFVPDKPPLAQINQVTRQAVPTSGQGGFIIEASRGGLETRTLVSPDVGICQNCLRELFDPQDRRYEHPFINCTDCGPRYTIIKGLPYDRTMTTMAGFSMCPACAKEYDAPEDRRFHAQPVACPQCGPRLRLLASDGADLPGDPLRQAAQVLLRGNVLAVKGLGGFHLAVDAGSEEAVLRLRERKKREQKPLAVMAPDLETAASLVELDRAARNLLSSPQKTIVLADKKDNSGLAKNIAPGLGQLGVMLAYTPLHHLLLKHGPKLLVMTSGNLSGGPICKGNREALKRLGGVADAFLLHDRDIQARADDSVARCIDEGPQVLRRARGYVPAPVHLAEKGPQVLALGPELKNTVCLAKGAEAFISPHIGDLRNPETLDSHLEAARHLLELLDGKPQALAVDLHPDYLSGRQTERYSGLPLVRVQHHAAHALSAMAELSLEFPFAALCLDGSGFGLDGTVWGGEILYVGRKGFKRLGGLTPALLPGGDMAARQPWRVAAGRLYASLGPRWLESAPQPLIALMESHTSGQGAAVLGKMMEQGFNSPMCSSLGRLFDAAAALMGLRYENAYEGQAAMGLESAAHAGVQDAYPMQVTTQGTQESSTWIGLDPAPMLDSLLDEVELRAPMGQMAARFHNGLIRGLSQAAALACKASGCGTVVLTGGCMMNRLLHCGAGT